MRGDKERRGKGDERRETRERERKRERERSIRYVERFNSNHRQALCTRRKLCFVLAFSTSQSCTSLACRCRVGALLVRLVLACSPLRRRSWVALVSTLACMRTCLGHKARAGGSSLDLSSTLRSLTRKHRVCDQVYGDSQSFPWGFSC